MPEFPKIDPEEVSPEISGSEIDELTEKEKQLNEEYKSDIQSLAKKLPEEFSDGMKTAKSKYINGMIDARMKVGKALLEKFKADDGTTLSPEGAEFISETLLKDYKFNDNNTPVTTDGKTPYNYDTRTIDDTTGRPTIDSTSIDATRPSIKGRFNDYIDKLGGPDEKTNFRDWIKQKLGYEPKLKFEKEIKKRLSGDKWNKLTDAKQRMADSVKAMETAESTGKSWEQTDKDKFDKASKDIDDILKDLGDTWDKNRDAKNMDPNKQVNQKTRLEFIYKIIFLLSIVGASITALVFLCKYCDNHTGCLHIQYTGSGYVTNNLDYCKGSCMVTGDESSIKNTFLPTQCFCSQYPINGSTGTKISSPTSKNQCGFANSAAGLVFTSDYNNGTTCTNTVCDPIDGDITNKSKYSYYDYIVMTPFDAAIDIASKVVDLGEDLLGFIIKVAIWIGAIIATLLILFIIYKVVSNRHKPTVPVSQYGKYLGNLNKYSNYGLMSKFGKLVIN